MAENKPDKNFAEIMSEKLADGFQEVVAEKLKDIKKKAHEELDKELEKAAANLALNVAKWADIQNLSDRLIITLRK